MSDLTFDAGALIALDRGDRRIAALITRAKLHGDRIGIPAGALGQAWRDGRRQARLARLLADPVAQVEPMTEEVARSSGHLCGVHGTSDVVDASVALSAKRRGGAVVTSDPDDLLALDATLDLIVV